MPVVRADVRPVAISSRSCRDAKALPFGPKSSNRGQNLFIGLTTHLRSSGEAQPDPQTASAAAMNFCWIWLKRQDFRRFVI
jgi:hypothetical protein